MKRQVRDVQRHVRSAAVHVGPDIHPHAMPRSASHFALFRHESRDERAHGLGEWRVESGEKLPQSHHPDLTYDLESTIHPCRAHSLVFERCAACRRRPRPNRLGGMGENGGTGVSGVEDVVE